MKNNMPNFVLVHGAWHGGWVWKEVAELLGYHGYKVTCPTQTGLGERRHLLSSEITIDTFIDDIVNHILSTHTRLLREASVFWYARGVYCCIESAWIGVSIGF